MNWLAENWIWIALGAGACFLIIQIADPGVAGKVSPGNGHHESYDAKAPGPSVKAVSTDTYKATRNA